MRERITVSVKVVNGEKWGDLSAHGMTHGIIGEKCEVKDGQKSFAGGHRVRLYSFRKNVWWKIPDGAMLDIADVVPEDVPRQRKLRART